MTGIQVQGTFYILSLPTCNTCFFLLCLHHFIFEKINSESKHFHDTTLAKESLVLWMLFSKAGAQIIFVLLIGRNKRGCLSHHKNALPTSDKIPFTLFNGSARERTNQSRWPQISVFRHIFRSKPCPRRTW